MNAVAYNPASRKHEAYVDGKLIGSFDTGRDAMRACIEEAAIERSQRLIADVLGIDAEEDKE